MGNFTRMSAVFVNFLKAGLFIGRTQESVGRTPIQCQIMEIMSREYLLVPQTMMTQCFIDQSNRAFPYKAEAFPAAPELENLNRRNSES